jgi:hypothetical protein
VLFPDPKNVRGKKIEAATQALRERFGRKTLTRAALLGMDEREGPQPGGKPKKG